MVMKALKIFHNNKLNQMVRYLLSHITIYGGEFKTVDEKLSSHY